MSLVKTWVYCSEAWEGRKVLMLPLLTEKQTLEIRMEAVEGLFVVRLRQDLFDSSQGGYVQRLRLRPWKGERPPLDPAEAR